MKTLSYTNTFAKVAVLTYCGGTLVHILRLMGMLPIEQMPDSIHGGIVILAGYSGIGFVVHYGQVPFKNAFDKTLYSLVVFHLNGSAILHAYSLIRNSNQWLTFFPIWYSYLALGYFAMFAYYSFRLNFRVQPD